MDIPSNWKHKSGYHLNGDGSQIKYNHEEKELLAIVERTGPAFSPTTGEYYTVLFQTSDKYPHEKVEPHSFFVNKENAKQNLCRLMEKHQ